MKTKYFECLNCLLVKPKDEFYSVPPRWCKPCCQASEDLLRPASGNLWPALPAYVSEERLAREVKVS